MQLAAADGHKDDVVLAPVLLNLLAYRRLDVGSRLAPFYRRGHAVLGQNCIYLGVGGIPDLFLEAANRIVLKE